MKCQQLKARQQEKVSVLLSGTVLFNAIEKLF